MICEYEDWNSFFYNILANEDDKKYAFFVGAGISIGSGLPPFNKFMDNFIGDLVPYEWKTKIHSAVIKRLRPEVLLQIIYQVYGDKTLEFYKCLDGGTPNHNHYFLALCLAKGHCIITLNVDNLIEQACSILKIPYETVYISNKEDISSERSVDVSKLTTYKDITENDPYDISSKIFKFHGSIEPTRTNLEKYDSIRFILNRVGLGLDRYTTEVLEEIIQQRDLVFLGYSGNDHFSVYPLLLKIDSDQNLYWFKYESKDELIQNKKNFKNLREEKINNLLEFMSRDLPQ
jgi:NAD-dependent SIR2 family protein deacetylase